MILQRDRNYVLVVGVPGKGEIEITGLHITFQIKKSSDNKKKGNQASVSIYNLAEDKRKALEATNVPVRLDVGYLDTGLHELFHGESTDIVTTRRGEDIVTTVTLDAAYTGLNHRLISKLAAPGSTVEEIVRNLASSMPDVARTKFSGKGLKQKAVDGYPMSGTPRQILTELCDAFGLEWQIDSGILYVTDVVESFMTNSQAFIINEMSGLIERPEVTEVEKQRKEGDKKKKGRKGLQIKLLLNPILQAGGLIKLEYGDLSGMYKIIDIQHEGEIYGSNWMTTITVGSKE